MASYVGLTDDPTRRKVEHGSPVDWKLYGPFSTEAEARAWERQLLLAGFKGGSGGSGWRYGYTYTITPNTVE